jgi:hypothetical protein
VAKGRQMGVHFTNHSPQLGVLVVVGVIVNYELVESRSALPRCGSGRWPAFRADYVRRRNGVARTRSVGGAGFGLAGAVCFAALGAARCASSRALRLRLRLCVDRLSRRTIPVTA